MARRTRTWRQRAWLAWSLSIVFHVEALLIGVFLLDEAEEARGVATEAGDQEVTVEVELEPASAGAPAAVAKERPLWARAGAGMARPDGRRAGRAGDGVVSLPAINLAPRDDEVSLERALSTGHQQSQLARRRSGERRSSPEDDTVMPNPTILTFVAASGSGMTPLSAPGSGRRAEAASSPAEGGSVRPAGHRRVARERVPLAQARAAEGSPARAKAGRGRVARGGEARPLAIEGAMSTPADEAGEQSDDRTSTQAASSEEPSLLSASNAGGDPIAPGKGGKAGPGAAGSGGERGPGARARARGDGAGQGVGPSPGSLYLRRVRAKIHASWSPRDFPRQAVLEGRGGYTRVAYSIAGDGSVREVHVVRPSGFPSFDAKMVQAVYRAAPFGPLPPGLGPILRRSHEFAVANPAVR